MDPDTQSGFPLIRIAPQQKWSPHHKYQHYYIWLLMAGVSFKWSINDIKAFFKRKYAMIDFYEVTKPDLWVLYSCKSFFFFYSILVPLYYHSIFRTVGLFSLFLIAASYWFVLMFSVNHLTDSSTFPTEQEHNRDWARLQVLTATNFAVGSTLWTWLSGGLNYQIEHHLFPSICHVHLPKISPIVQQACKEYNIKYNAYPSYFSAISGHYNHVKSLSQNPDEIKKDQ